MSMVTVLKPIQHIVYGPTVCACHIAHIVVLLSNTIWNSYIRLRMDNALYEHRIKGVTETKHRQLSTWFPLASNLSYACNIKLVSPLWEIFSRRSILYTQLINGWTEAFRYLSVRSEALHYCQYLYPSLRACWGIWAWYGRIYRNNHGHHRNTEPERHWLSRGSLWMKTLSNT